MSVLLLNIGLTCCSVLHKTSSYYFNHFSEHVFQQTEKELIFLSLCHVFFFFFGELMIPLVMQCWKAWHVQCKLLQIVLHSYFDCIFKFRFMIFKSFNIFWAGVMPPIFQYVTLWNHSLHSTNLNFEQSVTSPGLNAMRRWGQNGGTTLSVQKQWQSVQSEILKLVICKQPYGCFVCYSSTVC